MDTNIEHNGECPDCERLERQLDNERGRHQQSIHTLGGAAERLQAENDRLREALKGQNELMLSIIAGQRVVNLDEAIAYYNSILSQPKEETK